MVTSLLEQSLRLSVWDELVSLLHVLDCDVQLVVKRRNAA